MRAILCASIAFFLLAGTPSSSKTVEDAFGAKVTKEGFVEIAKYAKKNFLRDIDWMQLPDQYTVVDGYNVEIYGIFYRAGFRYLEIEPGENHLKLHVGLSDISVYINQFTAYAAIPVTCYDSQFFIGYNYVQPLDTWIGVSLDDENSVRLNQLNTNFEIQPDNYAVYGPAQCRGPLFPNPIIRNIVENVFWNARETMQSMITEKISEMLPQVEQTINKGLKEDLKYKIQDHSLIKDVQVGIVATPTAIKIGPTGMEFVATLNVKELPLNSSKFNANNQSLPLTILLGEAGIKPVFVSELLNILFKNSSKFMELNADNAPFLGDGFTRESLSPYLPDLNLIQLENEKIRTFIQLQEAPTVNFNGQKDGLKTSIKNLKMKFMVFTKGEWKDYFILTQNLDVILYPFINEKTLFMRLGPDASLKLSGVWASTYMPVNTTFNREQLERDFNDSLSFLSNAEYIYKNEMPVIAIQDKKVSLGEILFADPYVIGKFFDQTRMP